MRTSEEKIHASLKNQIIKTFAQTVSDLNGINEAETFLEDFLTESELESLSKRLAVAYWLKKSRSYSNIKRNLKVSSATVASIQSKKDSEGFQLALKNIEAEEWANQWSKKINKAWPFRSKNN